MSAAEGDSLAARSGSGSSTPASVDDGPRRAPRAGAIPPASNSRAAGVRNARLSSLLLPPRTHGIVRFEEIEAASDHAAIEAVQSCRGDRALELWQGRVKVHSIEATDLASR